MTPYFKNCAVCLCHFPEQIVAETDKKLCLQRKFKTSPQKRVDHICDFIYAERQTNYCLKNYENRLKTSVLRRFLVRVGRLELPASCSQSKRATNCATPGYGIFQLWSNMGSAPVLDQFPARDKTPSALASQSFPGFLGNAARTPASRSQITCATNCATPGYSIFCMIPCGERKSKFFVSVGGAVVKPDFAGFFQPGNFRHKLLSQGLPGFHFWGNG